MREVLQVAPGTFHLGRYNIATDTFDGPLARMVLVRFHPQLPPRWVVEVLR